jgi:uncharacterized protein YjiS (DUF1127 family)
MTMIESFTLDGHAFHGAATPQAILGQVRSALAATFATILEVIASARRRRRVIAAMYEPLDDRLLRDIGIERGDIITL